MRLAAAPLMLLGAAALPAAGSGIAEVQDVVPRALSAREIVERSREHWNRYDTSVRMKIQVVGRTGRWFERRLEAARVRVEGASRVLIRMLDPPDLRNTRLRVIAEGVNRGPSAARNAGARAARAASLASSAWVSERLASVVSRAIS